MEVPFIVLIILGAVILCVGLIIGILGSYLFYKKKWIFKKCDSPDPERDPLLKISKDDDQGLVPHAIPSALLDDSVQTSEAKSDHTCPAKKIDELTEKMWYHGKITNQEAESRLRAGCRNIDGAYLVYKNPDNYDEYILLVYHGKAEHFLRWKILKAQKDGKYILGKDGPKVPRYDTAKELIKAHRGIQGKPIKVHQGYVVTLSKSYVRRDQHSSTGSDTHSTCEATEKRETKLALSENCDTVLASKLWYHGEITKEMAEDRLKKGAQNIDGSYLVYNDPDQQCILLVYHQKKVRSWKILQSAEDKKYVLGEDGPNVLSRHTTIGELIKYHRGVTGKPIRIDKDHVVTLSKSYVRR